MRKLMVVVAVVAFGVGSYVAGASTHQGGLVADPTSGVDLARLVTVVHRALGEPSAVDPEPFVDVSADDWYGPAFAWAYESGIIDGVRVDSIELGIALYFADQPDKARRVGICESNLNNAAVGGAGEVSWLQIHPGWWLGWGDSPSFVEAMGYTKADLVNDPVIAAEVARAIYNRTGDWTAWTCGYA